LPRVERKQEAAPKLRIGIASSGRFHVLDLARELDAMGVDVRFYSYVPRKRAEKFGLPRRCHVALLPFVFPLVAMQRLLPRSFRGAMERLMCWALDATTILRLRRCDVFICMSGIYLQAARFAKWRYGAKIFLERGSRHIVSQRTILAETPQAEQVTSFTVRRELLGYTIADRIAVPSSHVLDSFAPWPETARKLFLNPYGVDLSQFPLRRLDSIAEPTVLFVGHWSYQKGADVLIKAMEMTSATLVHVGALVDVPFPDHPRFIHYDPVPQWELERFYRIAPVFVLASRQDGLAMVLLQALASGLLVVCTDRTGGSDLARLPGFARLIRIVPTGDVGALHVALMQALEQTRDNRARPMITEAERQSLSWREYALRYHRELRKNFGSQTGCSGRDLSQVAESASSCPGESTS
jgi:glycosyltransferase involved in cell wall biosynthesis